MAVTDGHSGGQDTPSLVQKVESSQMNKHVTLRVDPLVGRRSAVPARPPTPCHSISWRDMKALLQLTTCTWAWLLKCFRHTTIDGNAEKRGRNVLRLITIIRRRRIGLVSQLTCPLNVRSNRDKATTTTEARRALLLPAHVPQERVTEASLQQPLVDWCDSVTARQTVTVLDPLQLTSVAILCGAVVEGERTAEARHHRRRAKQHQTQVTSRNLPFGSL